MIIVTGGAGFIGSNLVHRLVTDGEDVVVIDSCESGTGFSENNLRGVADKIEFIRADIGDYEKTKHAIKEAEKIYNLAGITSHTASMQNPLKDVEKNLASQVNFLENCRRLNDRAFIVFTGTRSQYGIPTRNPVPEEERLRPLDANGINKTAAEMYHLLYSDSYGMDAVCLRLANIYGPRMPTNNKQLGFVGYFIGQAMRGIDIEVFGGQQKRDLLYVEDLLDAVEMMDRKHRGQVFNVGSGNAVTIMKVAETICGITGTRFKKVDYPHENKKLEVGDFISDISKIKKLGWSASVTIEEGLQKTIQEIS